MNAIQKNFVAGEWVESAGVSRNVNPSNTQDIIGEYSKADRAQTLQAIAAAKAAFPKWSRSTPQERFDALNRISAEIITRKDELGRLLAREEGKTLPGGHRRGRPRRADIFVLCRRGPAPDRRKRCFGTSRPRRRDYARGGRRHRSDHALEFSDRDPGMEDRAPRFPLSNCHMAQRPRHVRPCTGNGLGFYYARLVISFRR